MICAMFGTIINQVIYIINTYLTFLPGEYILLAGIGSVFGGFTSFLVGMYGYISDVTGNRARTARIALIDSAVFLGFPVGTIISGPIFAYGGYYAVFGLVRNIKNLTNTLVNYRYVIFFSRTNSENSP